MRSPACFILRSVWMVTFFKVHLRIVGPPLRDAAPWSPTRRFSAGQPASGYTSPFRKIAPFVRRATHISPHDGGRLDARPHRLVVLRSSLAAADGAHQVVHVVFALDEIDVARIDDEQRR